MAAADVDRLDCRVARSLAVEAVKRNPVVVAVDNPAAEVDTVNCRRIVVVDLK